MSDLVRQSEESGHQLQSLQSELAKLRADQDQRLAALEQRLNEAAAAAVTAPVDLPATTPPKPSSNKPAASKPSTSSATSALDGGQPGADLGEDAYTEAFRLWESGQYDQAIAALRAFTSAYPKHRRVSYANNLIGRALIEKGQLREAAAVLLANYRSNPKGERAADSLYYLGQTEMKLGQPGQACKAYAELDAVYGAKTRADLKKLLTDAKAQADCG